jgi:ABC-2 type transport system ATP-binding protein
VALMNAGLIVFRGTAQELVARGEQLSGDGGSGDSPLERGYAAVLTEARR